LISPPGFFQPFFSQFAAQLRMQLMEYAESLHTSTVLPVLISASAMRNA
jgi:hypothetical protein